MIKTLRITSTIAAIAAAGLLILPAVYGVRSNPKIEDFLKSPGIVEKAASAKGQCSSKKDAETSPLVKAAVDLTNIINPPPPPKTESSQPSAAQPAPPTPVTAKFDLIATSYLASHPERSFILIDEPGKGQHWVKQGSTIGHLTVETIKDGSIILRDGQRTSEMTVKVQESWRKLLKNPPPSTRPLASAEPAAANIAGQAPAGPKVPDNAVRPSPPAVNKPADTTGQPNSNQNPKEVAMPTAAPPSQPPSPAAPPMPATTPTQPQPNETTKTAPAPVDKPIENNPENNDTSNNSIAQPQDKPMPGDSPAAKEIISKINELVETFDTTTLSADESEKKIDELNELRTKLGNLRASQQSAKQK